MSLYIIATKDLKEFIPSSGRGGGHTSVDVSETGIPRLFNDKLSATLALGHWLAGPYVAYCDEGYWYSDQQTDPNRKLVWEGKLNVREVKICIAT